jgi:predicted RNase H-like HicB family nuclease
MAMRHFHVILEWDSEDQVWVTYVPALNNISTFGDTRDEALAHTREAIAAYIETAAEQGIEIPADDGVAELVQLEVAV